MRTDAQRIAQYIAKTVPTTVGLKVAAMLTGMRSSYDAHANDIQPVETAICAVLTGENIVSAQWGKYLAFGRQVWKREKLGGDPALTTDVQLMVNKWESFGCADTALIKIALDVFGLTVT